jgi:hypothetical protein
MSSNLAWRRPGHGVSASRTQLEQRRQKDCVRALDEPPQAPSVRADALAAAEQFLASTVEAVHPDLPAAVILRYAADYRAHLAAVVAASCRAEGSRCGHTDTGPAWRGSRPPGQ